MKSNYNKKKDTTNSILKLKNINISLFTDNMRGVHCLKYLKNKKIQITNIKINFKTENVIYQSGKMFLKLRNKIVKIN